MFQQVWASQGDARHAVSTNLGPAIPRLRFKFPCEVSHFRFGVNNGADAPYAKYVLKCGGPHAALTPTPNIKRLLVKGFGRLVPVSPIESPTIPGKALPGFRLKPHWVHIERCGFNHGILRRPISPNVWNGSPPRRNRIRSKRSPLHFGRLSPLSFGSRRRVAHHGRFRQLLLFSKRWTNSKFVFSSLPLQGASTAQNTGFRTK